MKTLLIVDIQNDFLPGGSLAIEEGDRIIPIVNELMSQYDHVVATQDFHPEDHSSFAENHNGHEAGDSIILDGLEQILWPAHCVQGTSGVDFPADLNTRRVDHIFRKGTDTDIDSYSGFYDNGHRNTTGLAKHLKKAGIAEVHIVGLATDYCVKYTALDSIVEGFTTTLIADACRGVNLSEGDVEAAIEEMQSAGVAVSTSDEILGKSTLLFRPVGPEELALLEEYDFKKWPPRLPDQPIFYPVMNKGYAEQIARDWNISASGSGYVTRFAVKRSFLKSDERKLVGGKQHEELWIPAEDLEALNANIVGNIEVIERFESEFATQIS